MDDTDFGTRDRRGYWTPKEPLKTAPLWVWPPRPMDFLRWLPGYFLPWNLLFLAVGTALWLFLTPARETLETLTWGWVLYLLARNSLAVLLFYGAFELRLYITRAQGTAFKFNAAFPAETRSKAFLWGSQNRDGMLRTFLSGVPIWTGYEVLMLWSWANGIGPWTTFEAHPVWLCILILLIPMIHDIHFYLVHRLIHVPVLYRHIHAVHHASVNPSPWSSLAMHPVEHLLYFSGALIHFVLPSHPLIVLYHLNYAGLGAVVGHIGYDKILAGDDRAMSTHAFSHYLHHRYFEVNYADGPTPLDKWFGTWHDGTPEGDARMQARRAARRRV
jgi:sterol desaturase/sphingolipid hydroxylase (fatty acid hydroxylase superfamily)